VEELFQVIFEDANLLVINKPAGLVCHPTKGDEYSSLISRVRIHLRKQNPEIGTVHMINRLDRETSGLVLVAKQDSLAVRLRKLWGARFVTKQYLAIVHGWLSHETISIDRPIGDDPHSPVTIKGIVCSEGAPSLTEITLLRNFERPEGKFALVQARPHTGRKHQIRIHLASIGHPVVGDKMYGGDELRYLRFVQYAQTPADRTALILENQALHAARLSFQLDAQDLDFSAPPDQAFAAFAGLAQPLGAETMR
jgi:23S rRNA pseudouridine1911/1915/1917 synthase